MGTPTAQFIASDKFQNNNDDWQSQLNDIYDTVESTYESEMSGWDDSTLYGGVIGDKSVSLSSDCRSNIEDDGPDTALNCLNSLVEDKVDVSNTDSVVVFDDYNYDGFAGRAEVGTWDDNENQSIRVAVVGNGGINAKIALHELLHTFNARHGNHTDAGWWGVTIMGPKENGCNGGNPSGSKELKMSQIEDCSTDAPREESTWKVQDFIDTHLS